MQRRFRLLEAAHSCVLPRYRYNCAALEREVFDAFGRGELVLHYQPIVSSRTERVLGAEALLRWQHSSLGIVSPGAYLHALDDAAFAQEIGAWGIRSAVRDAAKLNEHGPVCVNVNLSPVQLLAIPVAQLLAEQLRDANVPARLLTVEVTEQTMFHNLAAALEVMRELKSLGVRLALDDFGTGYNGLAQLQCYPLDSVKIDRRFVCDVTRSAASRNICSSMILLAHSLGIAVVAEGIETPEQAWVLRSLGCDEFQGYYYGAALPAGELGQRLNRRDDVVGAG